jgi:hypothetical protein
VSLDLENRRAYQARWYIDNKERVKAKKRAWDAANPERNRANQLAWYAAHKDEMILYSKERKRRSREKAADRPRPDRCEVCGVACDPVWEHNHDTGLFRGWTCSGCNRAMGAVHDDPAILRLLADYLEKDAARDKGDNKN